MKKGIIIVLSAVLFGGGIAYFLFHHVVDVENTQNQELAHAFQVGAFTNYDNALRVAERDNGIVVCDNDIYRVYVAILYDNEAVLKLEEYYKTIGLNYYLKQIYVSEDFVHSISQSEELLKKSNSDTYVTINTEVLSKYEEML